MTFDFQNRERRYRISRVRGLYTEVPKVQEPGGSNILGEFKEATVAESKRKW